jgi:hypothetical protein
MLIVIFPLTYLLFPFHLFPSPVLSCCQNTWEQAKGSSKTNPPNEGMSLIGSHFGNCCFAYNTLPAQFFNLQTIPSPNFGYMYAWYTTGGWDDSQVQSPAAVLVLPTHTHTHTHTYMTDFHLLFCAMQCAIYEYLLWKVTVMQKWTGINLNSFKKSVSHNSMMLIWKCSHQKYHPVLNSISSFFLHG